MQNSRDIKACLDKLLSKNDRVFIVPHNRPDMDALGAAIGMSLICNKKGKENYIVIDDEISKIESVTRKAVEEIYPDYKIINSKEAETLINNKSLMIAVDVNKKDLVCVKDYLNKFNNIFILDHHRDDEKSIDTPHKYIDLEWSCACEEVSRLLFLYGIKITPSEANYLLAGIILDTGIKVPKPNVNKETLSVIYKLSNKGANIFYVNNMFAEDNDCEKNIQNFANNSFDYGFSVGCDPSDRIYEIEDIAKIADSKLKRQVESAYVIGYVGKNIVQISARSKGRIDVSKIMQLFGGGGTEHSAAAKIENTTVEEVRDKLYRILLPPMMLDQEQISEKGPVLKLTNR